MNIKLIVLGTFSVVVLSGCSDSSNNTASYHELNAKMSEDAPVYTAPVYIPPTYNPPTYYEDSEPPTFNGYECTDDCSGHEAGYNWAEENGITDPSDCGGNSDSFIEGCESYGEEQSYEGVYGE